MREEVRGIGENRGVHSCHGSMIITDSSVIEDLLTAFHYQQEMPNETGRGGRGGGGETEEERAQGERWWWLCRW